MADIDEFRNGVAVFILDLIRRMAKIGLAVSRILLRHRIERKGEVAFIHGGCQAARNDPEACGKMRMMMNLFAKIQMT